jgi:hypothetical protein
MNLTIRTQRKSNANGRSVIVAKGGGKQRTIPVDLNRGSDYNHGAAAGTLAVALGVKWHPGVLHTSNDSGTQQSFFF